MNPQSLPFRLAAWYALLLGVTFVLVGTATFYGLQHYLRSNMRDTLRRRTTEVEQILVHASAVTPADAIAQEIESHLLPELNKRFVRVSRLPDTLIFLSGPPSGASFNRYAITARLPTGSTRSDAQFITRILTEQHLLVAATSVDTVSGRYRVETGESTLALETALARLLDLLALLLPTLIICAAAGGYLLVKRALRPVDQLSQRAEQMSLQDLSLRLPVVPSGDALERLAISLNGMLGRLRDSVQTSRRFLADASHELRTPLTVIKGELQELSGRTHPSSNDLRERVGSILEEVARLEDLVAGLLVLSRLDAGEVMRERTEVDLAVLAHGIAEQMRLIAEDRGLAVDLSGLQSTVVCCEQPRLKQVIVNLLDNAIRFTPAGGTVALRTRQEEAVGLLEVADSGIGIPASAIPQVFDRFFRVEEGRSRNDGGAGLGLSIVKSICSLHGAEIEVTSQVGHGSCFRVRFPRRSIAAHQFKA
jgi:heavy metal sensor kinase